MKDKKQTKFYKILFSILTILFLAGFINYTISYISKSGYFASCFSKSQSSNYKTQANIGTGIALHNKNYSSKNNFRNYTGRISQNIIVSQIGSSSNIEINTAPVAKAGNDMQVTIGTIISLNANKSYDVNGDSLTYKWYQISGISKALISDKIKFDFTVSSVNNYLFELEVSDGKTISTDSLTVISIEREILNIEDFDTPTAVQTNETIAVIVNPSQTTWIAPIKTDSAVAAVGLGIKQNGIVTDSVVFKVTIPDSTEITNINVDFKNKGLDVKTEYEQYYFKIFAQAQFTDKEYHDREDVIVTIDQRDLKNDTVIYSDSNLLAWIYVDNNNQVQWNDYIPLDLSQDTITLPHLSTWIIGPIKKYTPTVLVSDSITVFPNPFKPNDGNDETGKSFFGAYNINNLTGVHINGLTANAVINIYDILGRKIATDIKPITGENVAIWNAKNMKGDLVGSGTYFIVITDNSSKIIRKLAIIR